MSNSSEENTRKLSNLISNSISTDKNLYDFDVICDQKNTVIRMANTYLDNIKNNKGIHDSSVSNVHMGTWEESFPFMPERLLAIYANQNIGSIFCSKENIRPPETIGYPYKWSVSYSFRIEEIDKETNETITYNDYLGSFEYELSEEELNNEKEEYINCVIKGVNILYNWEIVDPTTQIFMDLSIKPVTPVEFIQISAILDKDVTFKDFINDYAPLP